MYVYIFICLHTRPALALLRLSFKSYLCLTVHLQVVTSRPLTQIVVPPVLTVDVGNNAEFNCLFEGTSEESSSSRSSGRQILWRKDGVEIRSSPRLSVTQTGDKLRIVNVQREDKGMYQCFFKFDLDMAQAAAELRLGGKNNKKEPSLLRRIQFYFFSSDPNPFCSYVHKYKQL